MHNKKYGIWKTRYAENSRNIFEDWVRQRNGEPVLFFTERGALEYITIFFEKENIDTANLTDEMMITIMGGLAQEEYTSISHNMRWSIKKRMENGTMKMCNSVFGYDLVNGELILNQDEAKIVRRIFEWYLNGYRSSKMAQILNEMGIGKRGRPCHWTGPTVRLMLKNEKYIGDQLF